MKIISAEDHSALTRKTKGLRGKEKIGERGK